MMAGVDGIERAFVGLGANVGDARLTLVAAVAAMRALPGATLAGVSRLYRTRPVGVVDQPDFLNAAVALAVPAVPDAETAAMALLIALKDIERALGRQDRQRWGPRELDLDLLLFGGHRMRVQRHEDARSANSGQSGPQWLELPHPSASERLFVLAPLADLAPDLWPPGWDTDVASARDRALGAEGDDAVVAIAAWDEAAADWSSGDADQPG